MPRNMNSRRHKKLVTRPAVANANQRRPLSTRRCSKPGCKARLPASAAYADVFRCRLHPKRGATRALKAEDLRLLAIIAEP